MTLRAGTSHIASARLLLRRITLDDLPVFTAIHADPVVAQYIGTGQPRSDHASLTWLQGTLMSYAQLQLGQLAVVRRSDGVLIGRCGLSDLAVEASTMAGRAYPRGWFAREQAPPDTALRYEAELGYTFARAFWGQGYASEAGECVFHYACQTLRLPRIISLIHPDNIRSRRLAERFNAHRADCVELLDRPFDRHVWPIEPTLCAARSGKETAP